MGFNKPLRQIGKFDGKFQNILNSVSKSRDPNDAIASIRTFSKSDYSKYIKLLFDHPVLSQSFNQMFFPTEITQVGKGYLFTRLDIAKELYWYATLCRHFKAQINSMLQLRNELERALLTGSQSEANQIVVHFKKQYGLSFWLIDAECALIEEFQAPEKISPYIRGLTEKKNLDPIFKYLLQILIIRADRTVSIETFEESYSKRAKKNELNQYSLLKLCFHGRQPISDISGILQYEGNSAVIDRYFTFVKICKLILSHPQHAHLRAAVRDALGQLGDEFNDNSITNLRLKAGLQSKLPVTSYTKSLMSCLEDYTTGNHADLKQKIEATINEFGPSGEMLVLASNASAHFLEADPEKEEDLPLFQRLQIKLKQIALKSPKVIESDIEVRRLTRSLAGFDVSSFLVSFVELCRGSANPWRAVNATKACCEFSLSPGNPRLIFLLESREKKEAYLKQVDALYGQLKSTEFHRSIYLKNDIPSPEVAPLERVQIYQARQALLNSQFEDALELFQKIKQSGDPLLRLEAIEGLPICLINLGAIAEAAEEMAEAYLHNPRIYSSIPFPLLISRLDRDAVAEYSQNIAVPICVDIYSKYQKEDNDELLREMYQNLLEALQIERASNLEAFSERFGPAKIAYFLKEICRISILDWSTVFTGTEDVENERVAVCRLSSTLDPSLRDSAIAEVGLITKSQFLRQKIQQVEQSKIYVNIEGIKKWAEGEIKGLFQQYVLLSKEKDLDSVIESLIEKLRSNISSNEKGPISIVLPSREKGAIFKKIIHALRDEFVSSGSYGLDGYLSAGIRHGTLSGELRSSLEAANLVSRRDSTGNYQLNEHWISEFKNSDFNASSVVEKLSEFSSKIDAVIDHVKDNIIQIHSEAKPEGKFDYKISELEIMLLEKKFGPDMPFDKFLDQALDLFWDKTEKNLEATRNYLHQTTRKQIDGIFDDVLSFVEGIGSTQLRELDARLKHARTQMHTELDKVQAWLFRSRESQSADFPIDDPFEIGVATVNRIYPNKQLEPVHDVRAPTLLKGKTFKALTDVAFVLFENMASHSGISNRAIKVYANALEDGESLILSFGNEVAESKAKTLVSKVDELNVTLSQGIDSEKVKREGKSGLIKAKKFLEVDLGCSPKFMFSMDEKNLQFKVEIRLDRREISV